MDGADFFEVGVVVGAFGISGEVKVFPTTDEPERFRKLLSVHILTEGGLRPYAIQKLRFHKKLVMLKLEGVEGPEAAQALKGTPLKIPPELALPLEENQYYHRDLLDMRVSDENGELLGVLTKILQTGANDVYVITPENGPELLIPAIKQNVLSVDVPGKRMTVKPL